MRRGAILLVAVLGCGRFDFDVHVDAGSGSDPIDAAVQPLPVAMELGLSEACAISSAGQVRCWGDNTWGKLGIGSGDPSPRGDMPGERAALPPVDVGTGAVVRRLSLKADFGCALLASGEAKCWGNNDGAQLGYGDRGSRGDAPGEMGDALPPVILPAGAAVDEIVIGHYHACLRRGPAVTCWGNDDVGQNGRGGGGATDTPQIMQSLPPIDLGTFQPIELAAMFNGTCARDAAGRVKCWGYNPNGELGLGDRDARGDAPGEMGDALPFVDLGTGLGASQLACGFSHCCALTAAGLKCWGYNDEGVLGTGDLQHRGDDPGEMGDALAPVSLGAPIVQIAAGAYFTCALLEGGRVKCFGANDHGQLGVGALDARGDQPGELGDALPAVPLPERARRVFAGGEMACAALESGAIACWGRNVNGELGIGDSFDRCDEPSEPPAVLTPAELFP